MTWWAWVLVGLGLLGIEVLTPGGFFVLFFGLAALVVGALAGLGLHGPPWLQWLLFSVLAVSSLLLFRRRLLERLRAAGDGAMTGGLIGDVAVLLDDLPPGAVGKAELRGTAWSVRHDGPAPLPRGHRCRVERVEGLTLHVKPE
jgi:membrane protein implicated in regulation of membrane protease activity